MNRQRLFSATPSLALALILGVTMSVPFMVSADEGPSAASAYEKGLAAQDAGQSDTAIKNFQELIDKHPDSPLAPRALVNLVRLLGNAGRVEQAEKLIEMGKKRYSQTTGIVDQLDALSVTISLRGGKKNKKMQAAMAQARKELKAAEAKQDMGKVEALKKKIAEYEKRSRKAKKGMMKSGPRMGSEQVEKMRREQEELIERAHALEDEGKTEEAFALRQKADELAAKIEANKGGRGKRNNKKNKANKKMVKRYRALREEVKTLNEQIKAAKAQGMTEKLAELNSQRQKLSQEMKTLQQQMGRGKGNNKNRELRRQRNRLRRQIAKAQKKGNKEAEEKLKQELEQLEKQLESTRNKAKDQNAKARNKQMTKLARNLQKQGLSEGEIAERLDFAKAQQELYFTQRSRLEDLEDQLRFKGLEGEELQKQLNEARQRFRQESVEQRKEFNQRMNVARRQRENKKLEQALNERLQSMREQLEKSGQDQASIDKAVGEERQKLKQELLQQRKQKQRQRDMQQRQRNNQKRMTKLAERLRKKGLSEDEIKQRLTREQNRLSKETNAKQRNKRKPMAQAQAKIQQNSKQIRELQAEVKRLRELVKRLLKEKQEDKRPAPL